MKNKPKEFLIIYNILGEYELVPQEEMERYKGVQYIGLYWKAKETYIYLLINLKWVSFWGVIIGKKDPSVYKASII